MKMKLNKQVLLKCRWFNHNCNLINIITGYIFPSFKFIHFQEKKDDLAKRN